MHLKSPLLRLDAASILTISPQSSVQGADKTIANKAGMSPVALADKSKRVEVVNALAAHSMDQKTKVVEVLVKDANNGGTNPPDEPKQP